jgi:hypothetical protein
MPRRPAALVAGLVALSVLLAPACSRKPRFGNDFEREQVLDELEWKCRTLLRLSPEHATSGARSIEITCHPWPEGGQGNYPGLTFSQFDPDWSQFRALAFDVYNPMAEPMRLSLRIDDREAPVYADRFNRSIIFNQGKTLVLMPLDELVTSGTKRPLDLRRIRMVALFLANPRERQTFFLDNIRLE